jgi:hypothetical protein
MKLLMLKLKIKANENLNKMENSILAYESKFAQNSP